MSGMLYVCATPIGNLEDMTFRVVRTLNEVDVIAAEDTRTSRKLLTHYDIHTPMTSYHEFNKFDKGRELVGRMLAGESIAIITDAGMPGISDPGEELIRMCYESGVPVTVLPGACALVTGLVLSGLPTRCFCFEAFLPPDKKDRKMALARLAGETRTMVLYEAPHRLLKTLGELSETLGEDRRLTVLRELTKKHETAFQTTIAEAIKFYTEEAPRGECVLVLEGKSLEAVKAEKQQTWEVMSIPEHMEFYLSKGMDKKEAMKAVATDRNLSKRDVYQALLSEE